MPLPDRNVPWPPPELRRYRDKVNIWDAWWTGDPDKLSEVYRGTSGTPEPFSAMQYAGGVGGRLARMWWGRPPAQGEPQAKAHVPLASDIARASADLLFSEPLEATADNQQTTDALDVILGDGVQAKLLEAAEVAAGLGGVYLRPAYNQQIADTAWIEAISPDLVIPEWISGHLRAGTLWRVLYRSDDDRTVIRHLERHEPGWTVHGLYQGSDGELGRPIPLTEHPETSHLADHVNKAGAVETGYRGLALRFVPNMRPSKAFRRDPLLAPLGQSDLADIEGLLDQLDEVHSSWMRDIRLAKGRIIVPEAYLETVGPGKGARFDPDREAYSALPGMMETSGGDKSMITVQQFAIRVAEHQATEQAIVTQALRTAGYSAQTFGDDAGLTMATATEVVARERRSFITRNRKIQYWRPELVALLEAYLAIDAYAYGRAPLDPTGLAVEFADSVSEDQITVAQTVQTLRAAGAMSVETAIREVHPDWTDQQVAEERERILDDERRVAPADLGRAIANLDRGRDRDGADDDPDPPDEDDDDTGDEA